MSWWWHGWPRSPSSSAAMRSACHHHHRPLRQQAGRGCDLEEDLGPSPALVFLDRPEIAGGESLAGQCRFEYRRRPPPPTTSRSWGRRCNRCRPPTVQTRTILGRHRSWCAPIPPVPPTPSPAGAVRPGWVSPSATPSTPGSATRWTSSTRTTAGVTGDRLRRRHPRRRLGRRSHPASRDEQLAHRDPADPAHGRPALWWQLRFTDTYAGKPLETLPDELLDSARDLLADTQAISSYGQTWVNPPARRKE